MINDFAHFIGKKKKVHYNKRPQTANARPAKRVKDKDSK